METFIWFVAVASLLLIVFGAMAIAGSSYDVDSPSNGDKSLPSLATTLTCSFFCIFLPLFALRWAIERLDQIQLTISSSFIYAVGIFSFLLCFAVSFKVYINFLNARRTKMEEVANQVEFLNEKRFEQISGLIRLLKAQYLGDDRIIGRVLESYEKIQTSSTLNMKVAALNELDARSITFVASACNFPQLKNDTLYLKVMGAVETLESELIETKLGFNKIVSEYNNVIGSFPVGLILRLFGFSKVSFMKASSASSGKGLSEAIDRLSI